MPEMKDRGIEWIGEIPTGWKKIPLKYVVDYNMETLSDSTAKDYEFDYVDIGSVTYGKGIERFQHMEFKDSPSRARRVVYKDDVILSTVRTYLKATASIPDNNYPVIVSTGFLVLTAKNNILPSYLKFAVQFDGFISEIESRSVGISYPAINSSEAITVKVIVPPINEQARIADFLDSKCSEIDALTADIQKEIDVLEEYKKSVITEAVTKGLDPNVEMKDSGTPWSPVIPAHWKYTNPKALFSQRQDRAFYGDKQLTASQEYGIIYQDEYMKLTGARVVTVMKDFSILKHVEPNDFVISMRSFQGGLEYSERKGCISSAYVMLIPNSKYVYPPFYRWFFKSSKYINAIQSTSNLVRDGQAMRYENFAKVPLFIVPIDEQRKIAEYLDEKVRNIDEILKTKKNQLTTLEEYKKSVIYEYVTGKKEVTA